MGDKMIKVGVSHGDINGIGYELILKTFEDARVFEFCVPIVYGSSKVLAYHRKAMNLSPVNSSIINHAQDAGANRLNVINCGNEEIAVSFSTSTPESEKMAQQALDRALSDLSEGLIDVLIMAPSGNDDAAFVQEKIGRNGKALQVLVNDTFRIALATGKMPLSEVSSSLTAEMLTKQIQTLESVLVRDFMVTMPRIAVLSYNPASGIKEQQYGKEETDIIVPAIKEASDKGIYCFGPYAADEFFGSGDYLKFDAVLAMYYDQGLVPFRSVSPSEGVLYTANLPYVITAPDQNVSFEKAGKNESSPDSFRNALYLAIDVLNNRATDSRINANPLRKQYFERGSDNEKLDLTKDEN